MIDTGKIGIVAITAPGAAICYEEIVSYYGHRNGKYLHPQVFLHHLNFYEYHICLQNQNWKKLADLILLSIEELAKHDLDFIIIPANTVHIVIDELKKHSPIKILSILDVVAKECAFNGYQRVAVLGTKWTMANGLYQSIFQEYGVSLVTPDEEKQDIIQQMILEHLVPQTNIEIARNTLIKLVAEIIPSCDAIALACTELPMVLHSENCNIALIDTTRALARAAVSKIKEITSIRSVT